MARTHTYSIAIRRVEMAVIRECVSGIRGRVKNKAEVNSLIMRIFMYSAIKIRANPAALYSTLNPETSSDSPSAKSNGVRFVSARIVINHIIITG